MTLPVRDFIDCCLETESNRITLVRKRPVQKYGFFLRRKAIKKKLRKHQRTWKAEETQI